ncbi:MAG: thrombospondin type 3 repeat-containing protein [archaeon]
MKRKVKLITFFHIFLLFVCLIFFQSCLLKNTVVYAGYDQCTDKPEGECTGKCVFINSKCEKMTKPVSEWIDIPFEDYSKELSSLVSAAKQEKKDISLGKNIGKQQAIERNALLESSITSLSKYTDDANIKNYELKEGKKVITYKIFNENTAAISNAVYNIRHTSYSGNVEKYRENNKLIAIEESSTPSTNGITGKASRIVIPANTEVVGSATPAKKLIVVVEGGIYDAISNSLKQYEHDLESCNEYDVEFYLCNQCSHIQIKTMLQNKYDNGNGNLAGAVFVGDLPSAWFTVGCWGYEVFPTELFFMDLNGDWSGGTGYSNLPFTQHEGNRQPEIFAARITAPEENSEIVMIINYFEKVHNFKTGKISFNKKALLYNEDDFVSWTGTYINQMKQLYSNYEAIDDPYVTTAQDYINRIRNQYDHVWISTHAGHSPSRHAFKIPGIPDYGGGYTTYEDIMNTKPKQLFYNVDSCTSGRYTENHYLAGGYAFQADYGLISYAYSKLGGFYSLGSYYVSLSKNENFGTAFKTWFSNNLNYCWDYGNVLIGDPTLRARPPYDYLPDDDGDKFANCMDNCVIMNNPDQSDFDKDGLGDACDTDIDGDGFLNGVDNCPLMPNPNQVDGDLDLDGYTSKCKKTDGTPFIGFWDCEEDTTGDPQHWCESGTRAGFACDCPGGGKAPLQGYNVCYGGDRNGKISECPGQVDTTCPSSTGICAEGLRKGMKCDCPNPGPGIGQPRNLCAGGRRDSLEYDCGGNDFVVDCIPVPLCSKAKGRCNYNPITTSKNPIEKFYMGECAVCTNPNKVLENDKSKVVCNDNIDNNCNGIVNECNQVSLPIIIRQ